MVALAIATVAFAMAALSERAAAGESASELLRPGARVRVKLSAPTSGDWITGSFVGWRGDTLALDSGEPPERLTVPTLVAKEFQVSDGVHSRAGDGALIGLGAGMAAGIGAALIACAGDYCTEAEGNNDMTIAAAVAFGLGGGLVGTGVGALVGSFLHGEDWKDVPLRGVRLGAWSPGAGGAGLALTYTFGGGAPTSTALATP